MTVPWRQYHKQCCGY